MYNNIETPTAQVFVNGVETTVNEFQYTVLRVMRKNKEIETLTFILNGSKYTVDDDGRCVEYPPFNTTADELLMQLL